MGPKSVGPGGGVALLWPVGEPLAERVGTGLPAGWSVAIGYDQEYVLSPKGSRPSRAVHPGLDLNRAGGDYGQAVYAVAAGAVEWAGEAAGSWGAVVLVHHSNVPGLGELWSQYAHLSRVDVSKGQQVAQGQILGAVGDAGGRFASHLHFELRRQALPAGHWPSGGGRPLDQAHAEVRRAYVNPLGRLGA